MSRRRIACIVVAAALSACGGTSSETPWPVEPLGPALGPAGESGPAPAGSPDADPAEPGGEAKGGGEP